MKQITRTFSSTLVKLTPFAFDEMTGAAVAKEPMTITVEGAFPDAAALRLVMSKHLPKGQLFRIDSASVEQVTYSMDVEYFKANAIAGDCVWREMDI